MEEFLERNCCIRDYHIYKEVWEAAVVSRWFAKESPKMTRCGCEKGAIIGYFSRKVSRVCSLFSVRRGGTLECRAQEILG